MKVYSNLSHPLFKRYLSNVGLIICDEIHSMFSNEFGKMLTLPHEIVLRQISKELPIFLGLTGTFHISQENRQIQEVFNDIYSMIKLKDVNAVIVGMGDGEFCVLDLDTYDYVIHKGIHKSIVYDLIPLNDGMFYSSSLDYTIKLNFMEGRYEENVYEKACSSSNGSSGCIYNSCTSDK